MLLYLLNFIRKLPVQDLLIGDDFRGLIVDLLGDFTDGKCVTDLFDRSTAFVFLGRRYREHLNEVIGWVVVTRTWDAETRRF